MYKIILTLIIINHYFSGKQSIDDYSNAYQSSIEIHNKAHNKHCFGCGSIFIPSIQKIQGFILTCIHERLDDEESNDEFV